MYQLYYTGLTFVVNLVLAKTTGQLKKAVKRCTGYRSFSTISDKFSTPCD